MLHKGPWGSWDEKCPSQHANPNWDDTLMRTHTPSLCWQIRANFLLTGLWLHIRTDLKINSFLGLIWFQCTICDALHRDHHYQTSMSKTWCVNIIRVVLWHNQHVMYLTGTLQIMSGKMRLTFKKDLGKKNHKVKVELLYCIVNWYKLNEKP